jgi:hypothetical protein
MERKIENLQSELKETKFELQASRAVLSQITHINASSSTKAETPESKKNDLNHIESNKLMVAERRIR